MSERDSSSESGGHHNIVLTPDEKKLFGQLFQAADSENLGVVTGELAVKFFEKSGLSPRILGEIWGIADTENRGLLTKVGFSVALRLIGQAQNGQHPRPELAQHPGPLPRFQDFPQPPPAASPPPPAPIQGQSTGPGVIKVPPLSPQDVEKFTQLFERSGAVDGILPGEIAKGIFQRSKLPTQTLIQIWALSDRQQRGALGPVEFVVAMHLIQCCKNGTLPVLPQILPPNLYDAAAGRPGTRSGPDRRMQNRGAFGPPALPPVPPIPKQFSGTGPRAQSPLSRQFTPPIQNPVQRNSTGEWAISFADKQRFDAVYMTVDKTGKGFITGEEAVPFFGNSKLPEDVLAQIWDLADINKAGVLNKDEFAIAMYLIRQQRSGGPPLPEQLPLNLIPPSMRQQRQITGPSQMPPSSNVFDAQPPPPPAPPKSAAEDLFGLDSFGAAPSAQPPSTVSKPQSSPFDNDVFGTPQEASPNVSAPHSPLPPQPSFGQPPRSFVPTSSFGQNIISPSATGGSNQQNKAADADDLLGDADPEVSKKLTNETTELANLSNQIGSLTKQTQELKQKRNSTEQELSTLNTQKQYIENQLSQLRAAYEKEATQVRQVEEQLSKSRTETTKLQNDYSIVEAQYHELQARHQEFTAALEADKRENESLKERMNALNVENRNLKTEVERLQSQARHQKGLVTISKKQVATSESERDRLKNELDDAKSSVASPAPASPTLSQGSMNTNPFYRKSPPAAPESAFSPSPFSPDAQPSTQSTLDDVFGPAFSSSSGPPPSTSFAAKAPTEGSVLSGPSASVASEAGGHGDVSTPPTSPPESSYHNSPQQSEAPPPSQAHQITSAFLPLPVNRADSVTSSVQVNPSASVHGESEFSRPDTPTNWVGSATAETPSSQRGEGFVKPEVRRDSFSVKSDAGTEASGRGGYPFDRRDDNRSPFGPAAPMEKNTTGTTSGGDEHRSKASEKRDSFPGFGPAPGVSTPLGIPGAFPTAENAPIKPTPTGESNMSNKSRTSNVSRFGDSQQRDPFAFGKDEPRSASKQDFDDAFNRLTLSKANEHHTGGSGGVSANRFDSEFPPIKEIHQDDSDSDTDGAGGFDDNFTPSSPARTHAQVSNNTTPQPTTESKPSEARPTASPPPATAQQSPPAYTPSAAAEKSSYPAEYSNLLPSRSDPMRHDATTPGGGSNSIAFPAPPAAAKSAPPPQPKDDFDDEFGDLTEAKEADDKADDTEFGTSSFNADFDPVFDNHSSGSSKVHVAPGTAVTEDDFSKFSFNIDPSSNSNQRSDSPVLQTKQTTSSQDWDAIFAGLDNAPAANDAHGANKLNGSTASEGKPAMASARQSGTDPGEGGGVSLNPSTSDPTGSAATAEGGVGVPSAGAGGDDDNVTKLTGMGFDRESSVKALEKNSWNLDRVSSSHHLDERVFN